MATWPPVSLRRSGCWAACAGDTEGHGSSAAIQRALMRNLLRRGVLTALRAPGGACFTTVLPVGWGEPRKGCGNRQPRRRRSGVRLCGEVRDPAPEGLPVPAITGFSYARELPPH